ncbi:hypothetical protein [Methanococcus maripaludis]|uniref:Uncharacterized protein n=2 Tax=Methanococcus maripaludis TaxID=39152 RepID=A0A7J9PFZ4_METMI|nr:hypothetical protein [Methanococcus maripaludis]MBA2861617.1 hypothetical protein [Methanococcus maripaludis]
MAEPFRISNSRLYEVVEQLKKQGMIPKECMALIDTTGAMKIIGNMTQDELENLVYTVQIEEDGFIGA